MISITRDSFARMSFKSAIVACNAASSSLSFSTSREVSLCKRISRIAFACLSSSSNADVKASTAAFLHTDFEKGFIRAEVIKYEDYIKYGSEAACREAGKISIEGKEYIVQDGDIMHFRFNV